MENESLKTKPPLPKGNRSYNDSLLIFDLPDLIEKMKHSHTGGKGELNSMILLESPNKQIVLTALHEGTVIKSFQSNDSFTLHLIEGKLRLHTRKESVTLNKGQLLTLHENIKYNMITMEETVLLLTTANGLLPQVEI